MNQCAGGKCRRIHCYESTDGRSTNVGQHTNNNILLHPYEEFYNRKVSIPNRRDEYFYSDGEGGRSQNSNFYSNDEGGRSQNSNLDRSDLKTVMQTAVGGGGHWSNTINNDNLYYDDYTKNY